MKRLLISTLMILTAVQVSTAAITVGGLRCEHLENPDGIDTLRPRLSWMLQSGERDVKQAAFEILASTSEAELTPGTADLWDSGKISSESSVLVAYAGKPLVSREPCFWKVRVWDANGRVSDWSKPGRWTMGILDPAEWHAKWIGKDGVENTNFLSGTSWIWASAADDTNAPAWVTNYFRRMVTIPAGRELKRAILQFAGDSECRAWIDQNDLGARNNPKTVRTINVTGRLEPGRSFLLGLEGRHEASSKTPGGVIGLLTMEFTEGPPLVVKTDDGWKVSLSPDAGWNTTAFDDSKWAASKVLGPVGMQPWGDMRVPDDRRLAARFLRKDFTVEKKVARATVSFCGLGLSELQLNGKKIGDAVLSPAFAQYDKHDYYVTYDVTKELRKGANAMGVILGNGRFYGDRSKITSGTATFGFPKLLLNLRIEFADGASSEVVSDESWKITTDGPILANNDFDGEEYDARREMPGWSSPGFDVAKWAGWQSAQLVSAPGGVLAGR